MMPLTVTDHQAPVPSPSYQRGQARRGRALHLDTLTLVTTLHVLALCHLAVRLAHCRCPPPLPAGPGGAPRTYSEETLLLIGLLRTLWRLSYKDMHDWLKQWPALALACGLPLGKEVNPRIPSPSQQCKRRRAAGAPLHESLFVLTVLQAMRQRLIGIPNGSRTVPACLLPGPKTNWVSGAGSNVFSGASSSSFAFSVHPSIAGLPSPRR